MATLAFWLFLLLLSFCTGAVYMRHFPGKFLFPLFSIILLLSVGCSLQKLRNTVDRMSYQCGAGYNPDKSYIKIHDPSQTGAKTRLIVLSDKDVSVTEKGCIERPQERLFVTNPERTAGIWVAADSAKQLTLEATGRVDLPSACNSIVHGNGSGFTLNFEIKDFGPQQALQTLEVRLYNLQSEQEVSHWPPQSLNSSNSFIFHKDKPILSGEYRLVAQISDKMRNAQSKSECVLRLDDTNLYISPADKISDKRIYNGQEVLIVQPGYNLNFYVHEGFRDVTIEYCLVPIDMNSIAPIMDLKLFECEKPADFLKTKSETLQEGFWLLSYRGRRGLVETNWNHKIFLVEKTCVGVFETVDSLKGLGCTLIRGSLYPSDLDNSNQHELDSIGRIVGNLKIVNTPTTKLNALPNLQEILGDLDIYGDSITDVEGFSALTFILKDLKIAGDNLRTISGFEKLQVVSGTMTISSRSESLSIAPFNQLQAVENSLTLSELKIPNLNFLHNLQNAGTIALTSLNAINDLSGLDSVQSIGSLILSYCSNLETLNGATNLKTLGNLQLDELNLSNLSGLQHVTEIKGLIINDSQKLSSLRTDSDSPLTIKEQLSISGHVEFLNLRDLRFKSYLRTLQISNSNLSSLEGLEMLEKAGELLLENLDGLTSLKGLQNLKSATYLSLQNTSISDISALAQLKEVKGAVDFDTNPLLLDLNGLGNLTQVDGDLAFRETGIRSLEGLARGSVIQGKLILVDNPNIKDLRGMNHIVEVSSDLEIMSHANLRSLKGIEGIKIKGNAFIGYTDLENEDSMPKLKDISALKKVGMIGGGLRLSSAECFGPDITKALETKVLGSPPKNSEQIPEGEPLIVLKQPSSCS